MGKKNIKPDITPVPATTVSVRFEPFYHKGIDLILEKQEDNGIFGGTKTMILKEALGELFKKYGITPDQIKTNIEEH